MSYKFQLSYPGMQSDCDPKDLRAAYNQFLSPPGVVVQAAGWSGKEATRNLCLEYVVPSKP